MSEFHPEIIAAVITASITLAGVILTAVYNFFHERAESNRHSRQIEIEERRAKIEENRIKIELHNQRQIRIFEARLESYPKLFEVLMALEKRALPTLTPREAREIEARLRECAYAQVSHCLSTDSFQALTDLRDSLILFANQKIGSSQLKEKRLALLQALHQDLGREGTWLGSRPSLFEKDQILLEESTK